MMCWSVNPSNSLPVVGGESSGITPSELTVTQSSALLQAVTVV